MESDRPPRPKKLTRGSSFVNARKVKGYGGRAAVAGSMTKDEYDEVAKAMESARDMDGDGDVDADDMRIIMEARRKGLDLDAVAAEGHRQAMERGPKRAPSHKFLRRKGHDRTIQGPFRRENIAKVDPKTKARAVGLYGPKLVVDDAAHAPGSISGSEDGRRGSVDRRSARGSGASGARSAAERAIASDAAERASRDARELGGVVAEVEESWNMDTKILSTEIMVSVLGTDALPTRGSPPPEVVRARRRLDDLLSQIESMSGKLDDEDPMSLERYTDTVREAKAAAKVYQRLMSEARAKQIAEDATGVLASLRLQLEALRDRAREASSSGAGADPSGGNINDAILSIGAAEKTVSVVARSGRLTDSQARSLRERLAAAGDAIERSKKTMDARVEGVARARKEAALSLSEDALRRLAEVKRDLEDVRAQRSSIDEFLPLTTSSPVIPGGRPPSSARVAEAKRHLDAVRNAEGAIEEAEARDAKTRRAIKRLEAEPKSAPKRRTGGGGPPKTEGQIAAEKAAKELRAAVENAGRKVSEAAAAMRKEGTAILRDLEEELVETERAAEELEEDEKESAAQKEGASGDSAATDVETCVSEVRRARDGLEKARAAGATGDRSGGTAARKAALEAAAVRAALIPQVAEAIRAARAAADDAAESLRARRRRIAEARAKSHASAAETTVAGLKEKLEDLQRLVEAVAAEDAEAPEGDSNPQVIAEMRRLLDDGTRRATDVEALVTRAGREEEPGRRAKSLKRANAEATRAGKELAQVERRLQEMADSRRLRRAIAGMDRALLSADRVLQRYQDDIAAASVPIRKGSAERKDDEEEGARVPGAVKEAVEFVAATRRMRDELYGTSPDDPEHQPRLRHYIGQRDPLEGVVAKADEAVRAVLEGLLHEAISALEAMRPRLKMLRSRHTEHGGTPGDECSRELDLADEGIAGTTLLAHMAKRADSNTEQQLAQSVPRARRAARKTREALDRATAALQLLMAAKDRERLNAELDAAAKSVAAAASRMSSLRKRANALKRDDEVAYNGEGLGDANREISAEIRRITEMVLSVDKAAPDSPAREAAARQIVAAAPAVEQKVDNFEVALTRAQEAARRRKKEAAERKARQEAAERVEKAAEVSGALTKRVNAIRASAGSLPETDKADPERLAKLESTLTKAIEQAEHRAAAAANAVSESQRGVEEGSTDAGKDLPKLLEDAENAAKEAEEALAGRLLLTVEVHCQEIQASIEEVRAAAAKVEEESGKGDETDTALSRPLRAEAARLEAALGQLSELKEGASLEEAKEGAEKAKRARDEGKKAVADANQAREGAVLARQLAEVDSACGKGLEQVELLRKRLRETIGPAVLSARAAQRAKEKAARRAADERAGGGEDGGKFVDDASTLDSLKEADLREHLPTGLEEAEKRIREVQQMRRKLAGANVTDAGVQPLVRRYLSQMPRVKAAVEEAEDVTHSALQGFLAQALSDIASMRERQRAVRSRNKTDGEPDDEATKAVEEAEASLAGSQMLLSLARRPKRSNLHVLVPRVIRTAARAREAIDRASAALRARAAMRDKAQAESDLRDAKDSLAASRERLEDVRRRCAALLESDPEVAEEAGVARMLARAEEEENRLREAEMAADNASTGTKARETALRQVILGTPHLESSITAAERALHQGEEAHRAAEAAKKAEKERREAVSGARRDAAELASLRALCDQVDAMNREDGAPADDSSAALQQLRSALTTAETLAGMVGGDQGSIVSGMDDIDTTTARQLSDAVSDARRRAAEAKDGMAERSGRRLDSALEEVDNARDAIAKRAEAAEVAADKARENLIEAAQSLIDADALDASALRRMEEDEERGGEEGGGDVMVDEKAVQKAAEKVLRGETSGDATAATMLSPATAKGPSPSLGLEAIVALARWNASVKNEEKMKEELNATDEALRGLRNKKEAAAAISDPIEKRNAMDLVTKACEGTLGRLGENEDGSWQEVPDLAAAVASVEAACERAAAVLRVSDEACVLGAVESSIATAEKPVSEAAENLRGEIASTKEERSALDSEGADLFNAKHRPSLRRFAGRLKPLLALTDATEESIPHSLISSARVLDEHIKLLKPRVDKLAVEQEAIASSGAGGGGEGEGGRAVSEASGKLASAMTLAERAMDVAEEASSRATPQAMRRSARTLTDILPRLSKAGKEAEAAVKEASKALARQRDAADRARRIEALETAKGKVELAANRLKALEPRATAARDSATEASETLGARLPPLPSELGALKSALTDARRKLQNAERAVAANESSSSAESDSAAGAATREALEAGASADEALHAAEQAVSRLEGEAQRRKDIVGWLGRLEKAKKRRDDARATLEAIEASLNALKRRNREAGSPSDDATEAIGAAESAAAAARTYSDTTDRSLAEIGRVADSVRRSRGGMSIMASPPASPPPSTRTPSRSASSGMESDDGASSVVSSASQLPSLRTLPEVGESTLGALERSVGEAERRRLDAEAAMETRSIRLSKERAKKAEEAANRRKEQNARLHRLDGEIAQLDAMERILTERNRRAGAPRDYASESLEHMQRDLAHAKGVRAVIVDPTSTSSSSSSSSPLEGKEDADDEEDNGPDLGPALDQIASALQRASDAANAAKSGMDDRDAREKRKKRAEAVARLQAALATLSALGRRLDDLTQRNESMDSPKDAASRALQRALDEVEHAKSLQPKPVADLVEKMREDHGGSRDEFEKEDSRMEEPQRRRRRSSIILAALGSSDIETAMGEGEEEQAQARRFADAVESAKESVTAAGEALRRRERKVEASRESAMAAAVAQAVGALARARAKFRSIRTPSEEEQDVWRESIGLMAERPPREDVPAMPRAEDGSSTKLSPLAQILVTSPRTNLTEDPMALAALAYEGEGESLLDRYYGVTGDLDAAESMQDQARTQPAIRPAFLEAAARAGPRVVWLSRDVAMAREAYKEREDAKTRELMRRMATAERRLDDVEERMEHVYTAHAKAMNAGARHHRSHGTTGSIDPSKTLSSTIASMSVDPDASMVRDSADTEAAVALTGKMMDAKSSLEAAKALRDILKPTTRSPTVSTPAPTPKASAALSPETLSRFEDSVGIADTKVREAEEAVQVHDRDLKRQAGYKLLRVMMSSLYRLNRAQDSMSELWEKEKMLRAEGSVSDGTRAALQAASSSILGACGVRDMVLATPELERAVSAGMRSTHAETKDDEEEGEGEGDGGGEGGGGEEKEEEEGDGEVATPPTTPIVVKKKGGGFDPKKLEAALSDPPEFSPSTGGLVKRFAKSVLPEAEAKVEDAAAALAKDEVETARKGKEKVAQGLADATSALARARVKLRAVRGLLGRLSATLKDREREHKTAEAEAEKAAEKATERVARDLEGAEEEGGGSAGLTPKRPKSSTPKLTAVSPRFKSFRLKDGTQRSLGAPRATADSAALARAALESRLPRVGKLADTADEAIEGAAALQPIAMAKDAEQTMQEQFKRSVDAATKAVDAAATAAERLSKEDEGRTPLLSAARKLDDVRGRLAKAQDAYSDLKVPSEDVEGLLGQAEGSLGAADALHANLVRAAEDEEEKMTEDEVEEKKELVAELTRNLMDAIGPADADARAAELAVQDWGSKMAASKANLGEREGALRSDIDKLREQLQKIRGDYERLSAPLARHAGSQRSMSKALAAERAVTAADESISVAERAAGSISGAHGPSGRAAALRELDEHIGTARDAVERAREAVGLLNESLAEDRSSARGHALGYLMQEQDVAARLSAAEGRLEATKESVAADDENFAHGSPEAAAIKPLIERAEAEIGGARALQESIHVLDGDPRLSGLGAGQLILLPPELRRHLHTFVPSLRPDAPANHLDPHRLNDFKLAIGRVIQAVDACTQRRRDLLEQRRRRVAVGQQTGGSGDRTSRLPIAAGGADLPAVEESRGSKSTVAALVDPSLRLPGEDFRQAFSLPVRAVVDNDMLEHGAWGRRLGLRVGRSAMRADFNDILARLQAASLHYDDLIRQMRARRMEVLPPELGVPLGRALTAGNAAMQNADALLPEPNRRHELVLTVDYIRDLSQRVAHATMTVSKFDTTFWQCATQHEQSQRRAQQLARSFSFMPPPMPMQGSRAGGFVPRPPSMPRGSSGMSPIASRSVTALPSHSAAPMASGSGGGGGSGGGVGPLHTSRTTDPAAAETPRHKEGDSPPKGTTATTVAPTVSSSSSSASLKPTGSFRQGSADPALILRLRSMTPEQRKAYLAELRAKRTAMAASQPQLPAPGSAPVPGGRMLHPSSSGMGFPGSFHPQAGGYVPAQQFGSMGGMGGMGGASFSHLPTAGSAGPAVAGSGAPGLRSAGSSATLRQAGSFAMRGGGSGLTPEQKVKVKSLMDRMRPEQKAQFLRLTPEQRRAFIVRWLSTQEKKEAEEKKRREERKVSDGTITRVREGLKATGSKSDLRAHDHEGAGDGFRKGSGKFGRKSTRRTMVVSDDMEADDDERVFKHGRS